MPDAGLPDAGRPGFVFLGFCAKEIFTPDEEWRRAGASQVRLIASVSECLSKRAPQWVDRWDYNRATCWNTETEAWAAVPDGERAAFAIAVYRVLPLLFDTSGAEHPVAVDDLFSREMPDLPTEPVPPHYSRIGFDIVERNAAMGMLGFGCSPLSCNVMAETIGVNQVCLLDDLETALAAARKFGIEQPEPGPYVIVEVLAPRSAPSNLDL